MSDGPLRPFERSCSRRLALRERLRAEWIAGAEGEWRRLRGRPMTAEELDRVLKRYPEDI